MNKMRIKEAGSSQEAVGLRLEAPHLCYRFYQEHQLNAGKEVTRDMKVIQAIRPIEIIFRRNNWHSLYERKMTLTSDKVQWNDRRKMTVYKNEGSRPALSV